MALFQGCHTSLYSTITTKSRAPCNTNTARTNARHLDFMTALCKGVDTLVCHYVKGYQSRLTVSLADFNVSCQPAFIMVSVWMSLLSSASVAGSTKDILLALQPINKSLEYYQQMVSVTVGNHRPQVYLQLVLQFGNKYRHKMGKKMFRPFMSFWEPILSGNFFPRRPLPGQGKIGEFKKTDLVPEETFDKFFSRLKKNTTAHEEGQPRDRYSSSSHENNQKSNPYEALEIGKEADQIKIKQAYLQKSSQYRPQAKSSPQACKKLEEVSTAFNQLQTISKTTDEYEQNPSRKSLLQELDIHVHEFRKVNPEENRMDEQGGAQAKKAEKQNTQDQGQIRGRDLTDAELYSESSYFEFVDGKRKLHITRVYNRNGRLIKVDRIENNRADEHRN